MRTNAFLILSGNLSIMGSNGVLNSLRAIYLVSIFSQIDTYLLTFEFKFLSNMYSHFTQIKLWYNYKENLCNRFRSNSQRIFVLLNKYFIQPTPAIFVDSKNPYFDDNQVIISFFKKYVPTCLLLHSFYCWNFFHRILCL